MASSLRAKLCKQNDYVNSLRTIESEEIRKVVLIQVEESQAQSRALREIHSQKLWRLRNLQAQRKVKVEVQLLMGIRDINLQMREEDPDAFHAQTLDDMMTNDKDNDEMEKLLDDFLKESRDQSKALVTTHRKQLMSLKRWQSDRRAKAEAERDILLAEYMDNLDKMYDEEHARADSLKRKEDEREISELEARHQKKISALKKELQAEEARYREKKRTLRQIQAWEKARVKAKMLKAKMEVIEAKRSITDLLDEIDGMAAVPAPPKQCGEGFDDYARAIEDLKDLFKRAQSIVN